MQIEYLDFFLYLAYTKLAVEKKSKLSTEWNKNSSKFLFLTGKPYKANRIRLLHKLVKSNLIHYAEWSLYSTELKRVSPLLPELNANELTDFLLQYQRNPDNQRISGENGSVHVTYNGLSYNDSLFANTKFRIIAETNFSKIINPFITEKTWITILNCQPFIMAGAVGTLKKLKDMGFRTFENYLQIKNYDQIVDPDQRLDAIVENTKYWLKNINSFEEEIQQDIAHNLNNFYRLAKNNEDMLKKIILDNNLDPTSTLVDLTEEHLYDFNKWYQSVKGSDWPECKVETDLYLLPEWIKDECKRFGYVFK